MRNKLERYRNITQKILKATEKVENTNLRLDVFKKSNNYYFYESKRDGSRKYLSVNEKDRIKNYCQNEYLRKLRRIALVRKPNIDRFINKLDENEYIKVYEKLHPAKKTFVDPLIVGYETIVEEWSNKDYITKGIGNEDHFVETDKGVRYRSKSERAMASKFTSMGLKFRYEARLSIGDKVFYPDFTFICPNTYEEIYWEHFGMMDDSNYARNATMKIREYEKNGIYLGERLIVTFEDSKNDLDLAWVHDIINRILIKKEP